MPSFGCFSNPRKIPRWFQRLDEHEQGYRNVAEARFTWSHRHYQILLPSHPYHDNRRSQVYQTALCKTSPLVRLYAPLVIVALLLPIDRWRIRDPKRWRKYRNEQAHLTRQRWRRGEEIDQQTFSCANAFFFWLIVFWRSMASASKSTIFSTLVLFKRLTIGFKRVVTWTLLTSLSEWKLTCPVAISPVFFKLEAGVTVQTKHGKKTDWTQLQQLEGWVSLARKRLITDIWWSGYPSCCPLSTRERFEWVQYEQQVEPIDNGSRLEIR